MFVHYVQPSYIHIILKKMSKTC